MKMQNNGITLKLVFHFFGFACWFPQPRIVEAAYKVRAASKQLYCDTGRHAKNEEVAELTGLSMKRLEDVLRCPKAPISLDQKTGFNQDLNPLVRIFPSSYKLSHRCHFCSNFSVIFCITGCNCWSRSSNSGRTFDQADNDTGCGKGIEHTSVERETRDPNEVWTWGWKNKDIARDWGFNGCEQRKDKANRVDCTPKVEKQKEIQAFAAICGNVCTLTDQETR